MSTKNPTITINGNAEPRNVTGKNGQSKTIYSQKATFENEQLRMQIDVEVDGPNMAYRLGEKLEWDVSADLVPGQYGRIELSRRKTLRPVAVAAVAKAS